MFVFDAGVPAVNITQLNNFDLGEDYFLFQNMEGRSLVVGDIVSGSGQSMGSISCYSTVLARAPTSLRPACRIRRTTLSEWFCRSTELSVSTIRFWFDEDRIAESQFTPLGSISMTLRAIARDVVFSSSSRKLSTRRGGGEAGEFSAADKVGNVAVRAGGTARSSTPRDPPAPRS